MQIQDKIILALDIHQDKERNQLLDKLNGQLRFVKVGMELFYAKGPSIIDELKKRELKVFLDLKLHDIPKTVEKSASVLASLGVDILNCHALGGSEMMKAFVSGANTGASNAGLNSPLLIAVTQLTSSDQTTLERDQLITTPLKEHVKHLAHLAQESNLNGVVASAHEVSDIKEKTGSKFLVITPGIRYLSSNDDQKRVMTPKQAISIGSDYLVIGRSITQAANPSQVLDQIYKDIQ